MGNVFGISEEEVLEFDAYVIAESKKRRVRPICIKYAFQITHLANQIGTPEKLKNMSIVTDILKIGYLGARMCLKDAERAADLSEGSIYKYFGDKDNSACQKLREGWNAVQTAGKVLLQTHAREGALKDNTGKMALELLKSQFPHEYGKQVLETTSNVQIQHQHILELSEKQLDLRIKQLLEKTGNILELKPNENGTFEHPEVERT